MHGKYEGHCKSKTEKLEQLQKPYVYSTEHNNDFKAS